MIQTIKDFKYAEPFEPFDIELSSGRVLHVETPDHVAFTEIPLGRVAGPVRGRFFLAINYYRTVLGVGVSLMTRVWPVACPGNPHE